MNENFWWWLCNVKVNEEICCRETSKVFVCVVLSVCFMAFCVRVMWGVSFEMRRRGGFCQTHYLSSEKHFPSILFSSVQYLLYFFVEYVYIYMTDWLTLYFTLSSFREELVEWAFDEDEKKRRRNGKWIHNSTRNKDD